MVISDRETTGGIMDVLWNMVGTMGRRTSIYHVGSDKDPVVISKVLRSAQIARYNVMCHHQYRLWWHVIIERPQYKD